MDEMPRELTVTRVDLWSDEPSVWIWDMVSKRADGTAQVTEGRVYTTKQLDKLVARATRIHNRCDLNSAYVHLPLALLPS